MIPYTTFRHIILFVCLFVYMLAPCGDTKLLDQSSHLGYHNMSKSNITTSTKKNDADDLTLVAKNAKGCQQLINTINQFLNMLKSS